MKTTRIIKSSGVPGLSAGVTLALAASLSHAQTVPVEAVENVNIVGLAVGAAPDYMGSNNRKGVAGPIFRYQFEGSQRYVTLLGPQATFNMLDSQNWRFGPLATFRSGRGASVSNATVKQMVGINNTWEGGAFLTYRLKLSEEKMHQINFTGDVATSNNGTYGTLRMLWWQPLREGTLLNLGIGTGFANGKWMQTYFGVTNPGDVALYPSLGGQPFNAGGGLKGVNVPFGITQALSKEWLLSVGGRYEKLTNDAKNSPVTAVSGNSNQWIGGAALNYIW